MTYHIDEIIINIDAKCREYSSRFSSDLKNNCPKKKNID